MNHQPTRPGKTQFLLRKLHSLAGLVPVGAFLLEHFYTNLQAAGPRGPARFDRTVRDLQGNPLTLWAEVLLIALPLLYHAVYGLIITAQGRPNNAEQPYLRNWLYTFQRITGAVLFLYIAYHVYHTRLMPYFDPHNPLWQDDGGHKLVSYAYMRSYLGSAHLGMPVATLYAVGIAAAAFHLANGLWNFAVHWGITVGEKAQRTSGLLLGAFGLGLFALGLTALYAFLKPGTPLLTLAG